MAKSGDVIVAGAGVIGLTTAYFLAREGVSVIVCDQGQAGMESSWAGAGILPPSDLEHAQFPLDRLRALSGAIFPALSDELKSRTGVDNGFARCGGIEFLGNAGMADADEWYGLGVATQRLAERDVLALEPNLAPGLGDALLVPGMAQLRNPRHLRALKTACVATGKVTLLENAPVESVVAASGRVKGVRVGGEVHSGGRVLVAAGAWTDRLLEPLGCRLKIEPVRGQIALLNPGRVVFSRILLWGARYLVPRLDGRVLIGSTEEHAGYDKATTAAGIEGLLALGRRLVPPLADAPVEKTWAGLRPGSPDGLPFLGPAPDVNGLFVAAGHFRAGIQLSPGTAQLMKEMLLDQPLTMPMDAFRLHRP
jgi:glycine oxidase